MYKERAIYLSILLEHKSFVPKLPHVQLLRYMANIWDKQLTESNVIFPILPIVIYHGSRRWTAKEFREYVMGMDKELQPFFPEFSFFLLNIRDKRDEVLEKEYQDFIVKKSLLLMKYILTNDLSNKLKDIFEGFDLRHEDEQYQSIFRTFFNYIVIPSKTEKEKVMDRMKEVMDYWEIPDDHWIHDFYKELALKLMESRIERRMKAENEKAVEEAVEKAVEKAIESGLKEGEKKGIKEGIQLVVEISKLFREGKSVNEIAQATQNSPETVVSILKDIGLLEK